MSQWEEGAKEAVAAAGLQRQEQLLLLLLLWHHCTIRHSCAGQRLRLSEESDLDQGTASPMFGTLT